MLSRKSQVQLNYMRRMAPARGGFMYEGARVAYDAGEYKDDEIAEMLSAGVIKPHDDPKKGWVVCDDYHEN